MFPWMMMAALLPAAVAAQGLPPLPPLPPLPGMEAPAPVAEAEEPAAAPVAEAETPQEDVAEVPQMPALPPIEEDDMFAAPAPAPAEGDLAMPDFGLFDPSALPAPPAEVPELAAAPAADDIAPVIPDLDDGMPEFKGNNEDAELAEMLEAPELPALPALPGFESEESEPTLPDMPADVAETQQTVVPELPDLPPPPAAAAPDVAELAPPELPDAKPLDEKLADALPSWMTDETLPSLKPLPQDRDKPAEPVKKAEKKADDDDDDISLADLIDKEINSGETYNDEDMDTADIDFDRMDDEKRVVWPKNFKTQQLPPEVYRKQYSNANRHLPHAIYQQEIEAHLFGAVGANDSDAVRALLRTGVPITIKNTRGEDLVMHAVKSYATTTLQLLLALGADPNQQDRYGATPLHRAVFTGRQDMATILLRAGANSYITDMSGVTPMSIAVARQDQPMMQTLGYYQASGYSNQQRMANYQPY